MKKMCLAIVAASMFMLTTAHAADFQKGVDAARAGDFETALIEFRELAEVGNAGSQFNLGLLYLNGDGVAQSHVSAAKWFVLAAEQGHAGAQSNLGLMYKVGRGVSQDYATAVNWSSLAAEQGYAKAQSNLGWMYYDGIGVAQDIVLAHMWATIAIKNGYENAMDLQIAVSGRMTQADTLKSKVLAAECMVSNYEICVY